jgi:CheY-like chemotaxis protein
MNEAAKILPAVAHGGRPNMGYGSPTSTSGAPMAGVHILCVDDDPDTCASLSDILTDLGYRVDVAYDGFSALQLVERNGYGLALLDYRMPGMDGLELYRRIKQVRSGLVGVFITAFTVSSLVEEATALGVRGFLPKPVNVQALLALVEEIVDYTA